MNTFGRLFRVTTFGESHGPGLGAVVDGCPAGVPLSEAVIQAALDRRRPGQSALTSDRREADRVEILSGVFEGKTLGTPIAALVRNTDQRSEDYDALRTADRPGHADAVWRERFRHRDHRGGGRSSGRETLGRVIGGAVAEALLARELPGAQVVGWVEQVGALVAGEAPPGLKRTEVDAHPTRCPDRLAAPRMAEAIAAAKAAGDSLGGVVALRIEGLPVGLGEPVFGKLKSRLADGLAGIGTVAGVLWGPRALLASLAEPGSRFHAAPEGYGGIQGGMANGRPVELRILCKPPSTLGDRAKAGRHDPCILPRVVPVAEAMAALAVADLWLQWLAHPHRAG
ncbi:MAG: chorismate synthase [Myxococcales bacterium]